MKITTLVIAGFLILSIVSCKKENNNSNNSSSGQPKVYIEESRSSPVYGNIKAVYNLTYDGDGRILSLISTSPALKFVYQYNSNNTFTMDLYTNNTLDIHELLFIGPSSFVDSTFQYNNTNDTSAEKYFYNSAKQIQEKREYDYSSVFGSTLTNNEFYTYDNDGNAISQTDNNGTYTFTYTNLPNKITLGSVYFPTTKYLPDTQTYTSGSTTISATHRYSFDNSQRLIADSAFESIGDTVIKSYTY
jgi:hypothetical protein